LIIPNGNFNNRDGLRADNVVDIVRVPERTDVNVTWLSSVVISTVQLPHT